MYTMITLLNPFSVSLKKPPFMEMRNPPVHTNGDYKIYKYFDRHYVHTFKNIVITELGAANTELIKNIATQTEPGKDTQLYFKYTRCLEAIQDGIEAAKKLNFKIV